MKLNSIHISIVTFLTLLSFSCNKENSNPIVEIVTTTKNKSVIADTVSISVLTSNGNHLFAGTINGFIYFSADNGVNWNLANGGIPLSNIKSIVVFGSKIFVGTLIKGVYVSQDYGFSFKQMNVGITNKDIWSLAISDNYLFAGSDRDGIYLSTDSGEKWSPVNSGLTSKVILSMAAIGSDVYAGTGDGVYKSTNYGQSWQSTEIRNAYVYSIVINYPYVFASNDHGISISDNKGQNWKTSTFIGHPHLALNGSSIYALTYKVFKSIDYGNNWTQMDSIDQIVNATSISTNSTNIFLGTSNGVVWRYPY